MDRWRVWWASLCRYRSLVEVWAGLTLAFMGIWINLPLVDAFDRLPIFATLRAAAAGEIWGALMVAAGIGVALSGTCPTRLRIVAHAAAAFVWLFLALSFLVSFPVGIGLPMFVSMGLLQMALTGWAVRDYRLSAWRDG